MPAVNKKLSHLSDTIQDELRTPTQFRIPNRGMVFLFLLLVASLGAVPAALQPQKGGTRMSIWGRDTWVPAGTSRILRIRGTEDLVSSGSTPVVSFSPGPVTVNFVQVTNPQDLTVSITIPPETQSGRQTLRVTDDNLTHSLADALMIVDGVLPNPTPSVLSLGGSAMLNIAPHPLFQGQTLFSLDLGPDVAVGPVTLQPDGSLQAPVSVINEAIPGTRSLHVTAGNYTLVAERGLGIDFGPPVHRVVVHINSPTVADRTLYLPNGYTAKLFAAYTDLNRIRQPKAIFVDEKNTLYVLSKGDATRNPPYWISAFDLSPDNYGAFKGLLTNFEASGGGAWWKALRCFPAGLENSASLRKIPRPPA
jgi:hypothetical protein